MRACECFTEDDNLENMCFTEGDNLENACLQMRAMMSCYYRLTCVTHDLTYLFNSRTLSISY